MRPLEWGLQPLLVHHDFDNGGIVMIDDAVGDVHDVLEEVVQVLLDKIEIYQEELGLDKYKITAQHRAFRLAKREKFDHQELLDGPLLSRGRIVHDGTGAMAPSDSLPWLDRALPDGGEGDGRGAAIGERDEDEVFDRRENHFRSLLLLLVVAGQGGLLCLSVGRERKGNEK